MSTSNDTSEWALTKIRACFREAAFRIAAEFAAMGGRMERIEERGARRLARDSHRLRHRGSGRQA